MKRENIIQRLEDLEKVIFRRYISTLINVENGVLVIDDELVSSRANGVETKRVSNCKSRK